MDSKEAYISVLLILGGKMECDKPNLSASLSSRVNICEEILVIVSEESNGKTQFFVKALSFF